MSREGRFTRRALLKGAAGAAMVSGLSAPSLLLRPRPRM